LQIGIGGRAGGIVSAFLTSEQQHRQSSGHQKGLDLDRFHKRDLVGFYF